MQDNTIFWEVLLSFLTKQKDSTAQFEQSLKDKKGFIPHYVLDVYTKVAEIGREHGLPFDYIEDGGEGEQIFKDIVGDTPLNDEIVLDYYTKILRMLKVKLNQLTDNISQAI